MVTVSDIYRVGDVVRAGDTWGVVRRCMGPGDRPLVDWWVGQYGSHRTGQWYTSRFVGEISAPFAVDYPHIPDKIVARSMHIILTEPHS